MESTQLSVQMELDETKPKTSLLQQHPALPLLPLSSGPPSTTQTLIVNYPTARLSSSPASSPNIVEPSIERKGSVHPTLGNSMERGVSPGADFFDDESSGSEWEDAEDEDRTQTFSEDGGIGLGRGSLVHSPPKQRRISRGRSRERSGLTALPVFTHVPSHNSQYESEYAHGNEGPKRARHVSVTRMEKMDVKVVHNHGSNASTPRGSVMSDRSEDVGAHFSATKPYAIDAMSGAALPQDHVQGRHRRNTSDSVIADSIINAHPTTMRALKALSLSGSIPEMSGHSFYSATSTEIPKVRSFSDSRHIKLSPISVKDRDHLPSHFVKTPYPFTAKKEFPKPATRPRHHNPDGRLDSGYGDDSGYCGEGSTMEPSHKGKQALGLTPSSDAYNLHHFHHPNPPQDLSSTHQSFDTHNPERTLHITLQKHSLPTRHHTTITIPSDLSTLSPTRRAIDFDDQYLAQRLHASHTALAGPWPKRLLSARKLRYICLAQSSTWSASPPHAAPARLLACGTGTTAESQPFTEEKLMQLYKNPRDGKARYTWVHWARRVASSHTDPVSRPSTSASAQYSVDSERDESKSGSVIHHRSAVPVDAVTSVQFVHSLSKARILLALALVLAVSAGGALVWVFVGEGGVPEERVGGGMAVGVLVLLLELLGFGLWVWGS